MKASKLSHRIILGSFLFLTLVAFNSFGRALPNVEDQGPFLTPNGEELFYLPKQSGDFKGMTFFQLGNLENKEKEEAVIIFPNSRLPYKPVSREQFIQSRIKLYREFWQTAARISFEPKIAELQLFLANMPPADRQTQAVINDPFGINERMFTTEAQGGRRVVAIDKDFFNPKLPRPTIQFITVYWSWNSQRPVVAEAIRQFKENFDFAALRQMLGK